MNNLQNTDDTNVPNKNKYNLKLVIFAVSVFLLGFILSQSILYINAQGKDDPSSIEEIVKSDLDKCTKEKNDLLNDPAKSCDVSNSSGYELIDYCGEESCLFKGPEAIEGYTKITGYYTTLNKEGWSGEQVTCDAFLVVNTDNNPLVEDFIDAVNQGNGLHSLDSDNNLLIRIDLSNQSTSDLKLLKNSSELNPVDISVVRHTPVGRSAGDCESVVTIIGVESK